MLSSLFIAHLVFSEKSVRNKKDSAEAVPETQQNLLMSNVDNSSDEDIVGGVEDDEYNDACKYLNSKLPNPLAVERLPLPNLDKPVASTLGATGSKTTVCLTDYQRDEQVKLSALEKHVKITDIPTGRKINGKLLSCIVEIKPSILRVTN